MLLMVLFYRELARSLQGQRVRLAEAWRNAQVGLYNLDGASVRAMLVEAQGLWREKVQSEETLHLGLFKYSEGALNAFLRQFARNPTIVDLKHPAIWAPYILVGCGDAIFGELPPGSTAAMQESVDSGPDVSTGRDSKSSMARPHATTNDY